MTKELLVNRSAEQLNNKPFSGENNTDFFTLINRRRDFLDHFRDEFLNTALKEVVSYWRDHVRIKFQSNFRQEIDLMVQRSILLETRLNGQPFLVADFQRIQPLETLAFIHDQSDWPTTTRHKILDAYRAFIKYLSKLSPDEFDISRLSCTCNTITLKQDSSASSTFPASYLTNDSILSLLRCKHTSPSKSEPFSHRTCSHRDSTSFSDWRLFLQALGKQNKRDEIIARTLLQGERRISHIINLTIKQIDFANNKIRFTLKKKTEEVYYEASFMKELKDYIDSTAPIRKMSPYAFVTRTGKQLTRRRINYSLRHTCNQIKIENITPDSLRKLWTKFKQEGYSNAAIMQSKEAKIETNKKEWQKKIEDVLNPEISK